MRRLVFSLICLLVPASLAWAHPGHGVTDPGSVVHHVAEPVHLLPVVVLAVVLGCAAAAVLWMKRSR